MAHYICSKCGKKFDHKGHYETHLNRVFPCFKNDDYHKHGIEPEKRAKKFSQVIFSTENKTTSCRIEKAKKESILVNKLDEKKSTVFQNKNGGFEDLLPQYHKNEKFENENSINTIFCIYCHTTFKNKYGLSRHLKKCKKVPLLKEDINHLLTSKNNSDSVSIPKTEKFITNITHNHNNITNNNIIILDTLKNIRPFGKEVIDHITTDLMNNIIKKPEQGIIKLIQEVHFNNDIPENHNILIKNKREPYVDIFNGKKWEKQDKKIAIQNIITTKKDIMDDYFDEQVEKNILTNFIKNNYSSFSNMLDNYVKESLNDYDDQIKSRIVRRCLKFYKEICKQAELVILNNTKRKYKNKELIDNYNDDDSDSSESENEDQIVPI